MTDPQIHSLVAQVQANTAQIQVESSARAVADEVLAKRIGSLETVLTRDIQSANYVPGVSGWKLNAITGEFEINSCTLGSAANAPERQMVSVEVASWSKYDLPKNAANLLQFMQAELLKVPEEYRHTAEFEEFDASYGDESFNSRLFLSYSRIETEEELADRLEKAKVVGTRIVIAGGCTTIIFDGVVRARFGNLEQPEPKQLHPFKVVDGKFCISEAAITDGTITNLKLADNWSIKMRECAGGLYATGVGMGLSSQFVVSADRFAINGRSASEILDDIAGKIGETELGKHLKDRIDAIDAIGVGQVNKRLDELKEKQGAENRAVAERLDSLATKLGELHTLITQTKDTAVAQAKREVAETLLRDLEADKSDGTLNDCIRRFSGAAMPFSGYTGHIPLKR